MASERFIMVSLEDEKSKELANVISNDTSRKILSFLTEKEASESEIAKTLQLAMSTVHYNVQNLLKNNLIEIKDFYWSDKGNKVNIYTIAKKLIVIAPKGTKISSAIKNLVPVLLISLAATAIITLVNKKLFLQQAAKSIEAPLREAAIEQAVTEKSVITSSLIPNYATWFLTGALFAILIYILMHCLRRKK